LLQAEDEYVFLQRNRALLMRQILCNVAHTDADERPRNTDMEAGKAFEKAAKVQTVNLKEPDDAANTYVDAFKVYRQESPEEAIRCLEVSIQQYCSKGNFRRAAQHKESMGDVLETQIGDIKRALDCYELAVSGLPLHQLASLPNN
jgi:alpha-soluble NSF attachment protein